MFCTAHRLHSQPAGSRPAPASTRRKLAVASLGHAVAACLLGPVLLGGCTRRGVPALATRDVRVWQMPSDGPRIPGPRGVAVSAAGEVYVMDTAARVLVFDEHGALKRQWCMPDRDVGKPEDLTVLRDGSIAVPDTHYHRVLVFDRHGKVLRGFGTYGKGAGEFIYPVSLAEDDRGNLYVCEYGSNDRVQKFTGDGRFLGAFGAFGTGPGEFQRPSGIVWHRGEVYLSDAANHRVQVFSDDGVFRRILEDNGRPLDLRYPYDLALSADGRLAIAEWGNGRISVTRRSGALLGCHGLPGPGRVQLNTPWGVAWVGNNRILVADTGNRRIVVLTL